MKKKKIKRTRKNIVDRVWAVEKFGIQILGGDGVSYDYIKAAKGNMTVAEWLKKRGSTSGFEAKVLNGNGKPVHGRCVLKHVRDTYFQNK